MDDKRAKKGLTFFIMYIIIHSILWLNMGCFADKSQTKQLSERVRDLPYTVIEYYGV